MLCIAHRGASGSEPENTLRSINRALDMGADGIEIDVQRVGGELIVIHDSTLERTTDGAGPIRKRSLAQLRALNAGKGERIPLLTEVLDLIGNRVLLNIELKGPRTAEPVHALLRAAITSRSWRAQKLLISSFSRVFLRQFNDCAPRLGVRMGILYSRSPRLFRTTARAFDAHSIHLPLSVVDEKLVARIHADGRKVFVYTVNEPADVARMASLRVDGIFTDFPDRAAGTISAVVLE